MLMLTFFQWENPRATAITYSLLVASIFAGRYLPILRWTFKTLYISLGRKFTSNMCKQLRSNHYCSYLGH